MKKCFAKQRGRSREEYVGEGLKLKALRGGDRAINSRGRREELMGEENCQTEDESNEGGGYQKTDEIRVEKEGR